jgi:hypothetical protein
MMRVKICPRCQGRIFLERDQYGWYMLCLQCGYLRDIHSLSEIQEQLTPEVAERKEELLLTR